MEILDFLQAHGIQIIVVIAIIGFLSTMRASWLDKVMANIKSNLIKYLILAGASLILSFIFTLCSVITDFNVFNFIKASIFNWIFSYIFYDMIKNLFFGEKK
jgi:hypothetical protein